MNIWWIGSNVISLSLCIYHVKYAGRLVRASYWSSEVPLHHTVIIASLLGLPTVQFLARLQYAKMEGESLVHFIT